LTGYTQQARAGGGLGPNAGWLAGGGLLRRQAVSHMQHAQTRTWTWTRKWAGEESKRANSSSRRHGDYHSGAAWTRVLVSLTCSQTPNACPIRPVVSPQMHRPRRQRANVTAYSPTTGPHPPIHRLAPCSARPSSPTPSTMASRSSSAASSSCPCSSP
jgi:hypothetical protein